ncbi:putative lipid II flippase FtsW [Myxococcota bacterium]
MTHMSQPRVPNSRSGPADSLLAALVIGMLGFGVVMVYSASVVEAAGTFRDSQHYLRLQALYASLGVCLVFGVSRLDYHRIRPFTYPILGTVAGLLGLIVLGWGRAGGGAERWLRLGPVNIQPSEAAKLALVLWLAYSLDKKQEKVRSFAVGVAPHLLIAGGLMVLCLKQPDFGGAFVLLVLTFAMLFVAGARLHWLTLLSMVGIAIGYGLVRLRPYAWKRILAWLYMDEHRQDLAYQPFQSVMSFGSGEWTGLGLGRGLQVLYLPESHTDFVAAIIGEELGFLGVLAVVLTYFAIVLRGIQIALRATDEYGAHIAFGISVLFGMQAVLNLGVAMAILPTKGLTLPFVSYGGSSLLVNAAAAGILLNISRARGSRISQGMTDGPLPEASATLITQAEFAGDSAGAEARSVARLRRGPGEARA